MWIGLNNLHKKCSINNKCFALLLIEIADNLNILDEKYKNSKYF